MSESILDEFRTAGPCEVCGASCLDREPHHVITRGAHGPDMRENLVAIGPHDTPWVCRCHALIHQGLIPRLCVLSIVALREGLTVDEVLRRINTVRWNRSLP